MCNEITRRLEVDATCLTQVWVFDVKKTRARRGHNLRQWANLIEGSYGARMMFMTLKLLSKHEKCDDEHVHVRFRSQRQKSIFHDKTWWHRKRQDMMPMLLKMVFLNAREHGEHIHVCFNVLTSKFTNQPNPSNTPGDRHIVPMGLILMSIDRGDHGAHIHWCNSRIY